MKMVKHCTHLLTVLLMSGLSFPVWAADWQIDSDASRLNFVSIKATHVAEVNQFRSFSGSLTEAGQLTLDIDLSSVDTKVELRDDRMREHLFRVERFATATLTAEVDTSVIEQLALGDSTTASLTAVLDLHGKQQNVAMDVLISKLAENRLLVNSAHPVLLDVSDYDLVKGVEKLRDLVSLPNISHAVPVTFYLTLHN